MILNVCSYNSHGLGVGRAPYIIQELINEYQFVMLQEHWLFNEQLGQLQDDFSNINIHGVSGMDPEVPLMGRPYGGCCILCHRHLSGTVTPIATNSKRLFCVLYDTGTVKILVFVCTCLVIEQTTLSMRMS